MQCKNVFLTQRETGLLGCLLNLKYNLYSLLDEDMSPICISVYRKFNLTWTISSGIMSRLHKAKKSLSSAALLEAS